MIMCFNPCYVGLWSVSQDQTGLTTVMLDSFNPCYVGLWSVSISHEPPVACHKCFNPCYVGLWSVSLLWRRSGVAGLRFNPCYVGLWSVSCWRSHYLIPKIVSILVMLDYGL